MKLGILGTLLLVLVACGRTERTEVPSTQAVSPLPAASPWSWHPLGGLAVVEGEVTEATELILEGHSIRERRFAEQGPVRWEFFRPPAGETVVLRTADGRVLAHFEFSLPTESAKAHRLAQGAAPPALAAPKVRAETRLKNLPLPALPERKPMALPAPVHEGPAPRRPAETSPRSSLVLHAAPVESSSKTQAKTKLRDRSVPPIPDRYPLLLPNAATPLETPNRSPTHVPNLFEPTPPVPPAAALATPVPLKGPLKGTGVWPGMGEALNLTRGPGGQKRILLSFDGGSSAEVATEVLDLLRARGVHTTLFLTGAFIQRYPALVKRMAAEGHEIGNHTMNHPHFAPGLKRDPKWTRERVQRELLEADAALMRLLGRPMDPFWRAPYGEQTAEIRRWAEELGYRHVGWSEGADTLDWATAKDRRLYRSGEAIVARLEKRLGRDGDGLIVLMHLGSARELGDRPTEGLGTFMDHARNEGWTFVSAGTILRDLGKPAWDPHQRLALLNGSFAQSR
jgi:peptidoglycan/xylan/chitin deacetylase (PgdA/CDA1 family)